jgi:hypothetical protein
LQFPQERPRYRQAGNELVTTDQRNAAASNWDGILVNEHPGRRIRVPAEVLASILLLVVPFLTFLHFHAYSILRPSVLAVVLGLAAIGAAVGWCMHRTRSTLLRVLIMATLLAVSVDLVSNTSGNHWVKALVFLGATWILRNQVARIASAMAIAFGIATLAFGTQAAEENRREMKPGEIRQTDTVVRDGAPPPLLHLVADEHMGIQGIPSDIEEGAELKQEMIRFYVEHGFRLYTRAYSRYYSTADALPNDLNFAESRLKQGWVGGSSASFPASLGRNEYFERLVQQGYDLRVYQPTYLDFCATQAAQAPFCFTMPNNSLSHLPALDLNEWSNARFIASFWITNRSSLYLRIWGFYNQRLRPALAARNIPALRWNWTKSNLQVVGALRLLKVLSRDVQSARPLRGTAFFAHVLLPHVPYLLDERCVPDSKVDLRSPGWLSAQKVTPEQRRTLYQLYLRQLRCWNSQLEHLLGVMASRGAKDAVVIVQGDHGSRIGTMPAPGESMTGEQMADYFSTLFAIRGPGVVPGVDTAVVSVKDLLDRFSAAEFKNVAVPSHPDPYVFLVAGSVLRPVPAPEFWIQARLTGGPLDR